MKKAFYEQVAKVMGLLANFLTIAIEKAHGEVSLINQLRPLAEMALKKGLAESGEEDDATKRAEVREAQLERYRAEYGPEVVMEVEAMRGEYSSGAVSFRRECEELRRMKDPKPQKLRDVNQER